MDLGVIERRVNALWKHKTRVEGIIGPPEQPKEGMAPGEGESADHPAQILHRRIDTVSSELAGLRKDMTETGGSHGERLKALEDRLDSIQTHLGVIVDELKAAQDVKAGVSGTDQRETPKTEQAPA